MKCPVCNTENRDTATFCASCGARLTPPASAQGEEPFSLEAAGGQGSEGQGAAQPPVPARAEPRAVSIPPPPDLSTRRLVPPHPAEEQQEPEPEAPEKAGPLQPGDMVAGRFEVVEVLESTPDYHRYHVRDWGRCANCGYDDNARGDRFCLDCGASLETPVYATITELVRRKPEAYDLALCEGEREYFVSFEEAAPPAAAQSVAAGPLTLRWGGATDAGQQRDHNEDYIDSWSFSQGAGTMLGLFVVADGLGGQDSGEVASRMAVDEVWKSLRESVWEPVVRGDTPEPPAVREAVQAAVQSANRAVFEARQAAGSQMSTTVTLALVVGRTAYVANVGDSRTYLFGAQGLRRITHDHSLVQRLVDAGRITPEEVYSHPQRNLIYQSVGDRPEIEADLFEETLASGDRLILCSDGLWEMVRDEGLQDTLMAEPDPQRACDTLVRHANLAGGEDNISVIIVQALGA